jgi:branched-chain amino acid transport system permease protein
MAVDLTFLLPFLGTTFGISLILALSFNLEYGYGGQPNLGKVFFYSIGAYAAGGITAHVLWALAGAPADIPFFEARGAVVRLAFARGNPGAIVAVFIASLLAAAVIGTGFGFLASYPALRLRGDFLAITLIAVGEASRVFALNYQPLAGGVFGLPGIPNPFVWLPPRTVDAAYAGLVLAITAGVYFLVVRLSNSPLGRLLKSIRDDEVVASVYGKDIPRAKAKILAISSGIAAISGALYVYYVQQVFAGDFIPLISFAAVTMVILGGVASHKGVVVGAILMTLLDLMTRPVFFAMFDIYWRPPFDMNYVRYVVMGVIIVLVLMFRPAGLVPERPVETAALSVARRMKSPDPAKVDQPNRPVEEDA